MNVQPYEVEFLKSASQIPDELWETCFQVPGEGHELIIQPVDDPPPFGFVDDAKEVGELRQIG